MRVDQYLWAVRYYKSRNQAAEACKKGLVVLNGRKVKPSREVFAGDRIELRKNSISYTLEILDIPKSRVGAKLTGLYVRDTTPAQAFEHSEVNRLMMQGKREKGSGRPTKKERRDWEDYWEE